MFRTVRRRADKKSLFLLLNIFVLILKLYCNTKLKDFYSKSEFINEVEGETFG